MKKTNKTLAVAALLAMGVASSQAQWTYVDAIDFNNHPLSPTLDPNGGSGPPFYQENTFLSGGAPFVTDLGDGTSNWRYRNTGPGNVSYLNNSYQGRNLNLNEGDPALFTTITGLVPDTVYTIKLYGVWSGGNNNWNLSYSLNGGASWNIGISRDAISNAGMLGYGQGWVDASGDGVGAPVTLGSSDTRSNMIIGTMTSNPSGEITVGVWNHYSSNLINTERGVYDGLAYAIGVVPEPTTFALTGLGAAALLIFRRRNS